MHLILPLAFTLSPLLPWVSGWYGLPIAVAAAAQARDEAAAAGRNASGLTSGP